VPTSVFKYVPLGVCQGAFVGLRLHLFGLLRVEHDGRDQALPPSRKVRALLGYLVLTPRAVTRTSLCELLWPDADDPRAELRWHLTKVRRILDTDLRPRVVADHERISLDLEDAQADALQFGAAIEGALATRAAADLRGLVQLVHGELLEGLNIEQCPLFDQWLNGERQRFKTWHLRALDRLISFAVAESEESLELLRMRLALTPYDAAVRETLRRSLVAQGYELEAQRLSHAAARLAEESDTAISWRAPERSSPAGIPANVIPIDRARLPTIEAMQDKSTQQPQSDSSTAATSSRRASVLVMPFSAATPADSALANGLTHDIIFGLAKLRSLMVIARGTAFAMRARAASPLEAAKLLQVDYVSSGTLVREGERLVVEVELAAANGQILWTERYTSSSDDMLLLPTKFANEIIVQMNAQMHASERARALLKPPNSLDAWESYHRGLWHMYRFSGAENEAAQLYFRRAIQLDPGFAPSYAGLSFTHFQNAFLFKTHERQSERDAAFATAGQGLMADALDPSVHWAMGRALWLRGTDGSALRSLQEAVELSPNFAMGHYALSFVNSQTGDPNAALAAADRSLELSPYDPMLFAMHASKTFGYLRLDNRDGATQSAHEILRMPNAHVHARAIGALTLAAVGLEDEAVQEFSVIHQDRPGYGLQEFFTAFRFKHDLETLYRDAAKKIRVR